MYPQTYQYFLIMTCKADYLCSFSMYTLITLHMHQISSDINSLESWSLSLFIASLSILKMLLRIKFEKIIFW